MHMQRYIFWRRMRGIATFLAILATLALIVFGITRLYRFFTSPSSSVNLEQSSVVIQIQSLNRLETASYTIEKVIQAGTDGNAFQNILYGDRILLIAHAEVIGGVDLSKLRTEDVEVGEGTLDITLPPSEILVSRLDNEKTRVYDRQSGLFTPERRDLESEARAQAEQSIRQAACDSGILETAAENARKQVEAMFRGAGFGEVVVRGGVGVCE